MEYRREMSTGLQMAALVHDLRTPMCAAAGAAQMALTLLETAAFVLLAAHMLLAAARARGVLCPKLRGEKASLAVVSVCAGVGLGALIACGLDRVLPAAPGLLVPLLAALMYYGRKRCG